MEQNLILVTQSFGREYEYRRVALTILSFYACSSNKQVRTVLFTDNPGWFASCFEALPVTYVLLTPEKISSMRGGIDFLHRMKIALIEEAFDTYQADILYADSDTFFIEDPIPVMQRLNPDTSYMHLREYAFEYVRDMPLPAGKTFRAFVSLIEKQDFDLADGTRLHITAQHASWNAGVMMLHHTHRRFISDVYALTDVFYRNTENHASEQYAFSVMLQTQTILSPCDTVIYHYWYHVKKKIADEFLAARFHELHGLSQEQKLARAGAWTALLPSLFRRHVYAYKDDAIQAFNINRFSAGYRAAAQALLRGGITDTGFIRDILYHIKRHIKGSR